MGSGTPIGGHGGPEESGPDAPPTPPPEEIPVDRELQALTQPLGLGATEPRRLSMSEMVNSIRLIFNVDVAEDAAALPGNVAFFDNDLRGQDVDGNYVFVAGKVAKKVAASLLQDTALLNELIPCEESSRDRNCFESFVRKTGKRLFRRPLNETEISKYSDTLWQYAVSDSFDEAATMAIESLLQSFEFLFRIEFGQETEAEDGIVKLTSHEIASRLSFLLTGQSPNEILLRQADENRLQTPEQIRAAAQTLLARPEGERQIARFHAMWLGYSELPFDEQLSRDLRSETDALIKKNHL